jgi:hypothetical protein
MGSGISINDYYDIFIISFDNFPSLERVEMIPCDQIDNEVFKVETCDVDDELYQNNGIYADILCNIRPGSVPLCPA